MNVIEIPMEQLCQATWNANRMNQPMMDRLKESIRRYGFLENLIVRPIPEDLYEVIGGNWRLKALSEMHFQKIPCVVVDLNDAHARLLAQALNRIEGEDDLLLRAELVKKALESVSAEDILSILPETAQSLRDISSLGQADLAQHLQAWEEAQAARLKHMQLQFTSHQVEVVREAVNRILPQVRESSWENPNSRGNAIFLLSKFYLEREPEQ